MLPHLHKTPSHLFNCTSFTKSKSYINHSFSFLFLFLHFSKREKPSQFPPPSQPQPPTPKASPRPSSPSQATTLDWRSSPSSSEISRWINLSTTIIKLRLTVPSEYFYSPRLVSFLVYLYLHILCTYVIKIIFLDHQTQPANSVLYPVF